MNKQCPLMQIICIQNECAWWSIPACKCGVLNVSESLQRISCKVNDAVTTLLDGTVSNKMFVDGAGGDNISLNERENEPDFCDGCDYYSIDRQLEKCYCLKYRHNLPFTISKNTQGRLNICLIEQGYK